MAALVVSVVPLVYLFGSKSVLCALHNAIARTALVLPACAAFIALPYWLHGPRVRKAATLACTHWQCELR